MNVLSKKKESPIPACGRDGAVCVVWVVVLSVAPLLRRSLRTREMTMSEASKQPSTRHPVFGENTFSQPLMKSYSAAFPIIVAVVPLASAMGIWGYKAGFVIRC